jgi:hypothetical protein
MGWLPYDNEQRTQLDGEIAELQAKIQDRQRRRNALAPACRIPVELLQTIFLICRNDALDPTGLSHDQRWTSVAEVCSTWRAAARSYPSLWDHVEYVPNHRISAGPNVPLAKARPLHVRVHFADTTCGAEGISAQVLGQARELHLHDVPRGLVDDERSAFRHPTPALEILSVLAAPASDAEFIPHLSRDFLGRSAPLLREATLTNVIFKWKDTQFLRAVERLKLTGGAVLGGDDIFSALSPMKRLRSLHMEVGMAEWHFFNRAKPVTLTNLEELFFRQSGVWVALILRGLRAPALRRCTVFDERPTRDSINAAIDFARRYRDDLAARACTIQELSFSANSVEASESLSDGSCVLKYEIPPDEAVPVSNWVHRISAAISVSQVTHLRVGKGVSGELWQLMAPRLSELKTITFTDETSAASVVDADLQHGPFFVALKSVHLEDTSTLHHVGRWLDSRCARGDVVKAAILVYSS